MSIDHDVAPGPLTRCQITGSTDLYLILDLGHQPPCNALLTSDQLAEPEVTYPLRLFLCPESGLAQLDYVVEGHELYPPDYPYRSGLSLPLVEYQRSVAQHIVRECAISEGALCVDIGSNDGTLLGHLKNAGFRALGIEPTNIARIARAQGVDTVQDFFTAAVAQDIVRQHGRARLVTMTNAFAHMAGLGEVMRGLLELLASDGVFVTESHYLLDVLEQNQFDTIYHEHIRTYSLKSLVTLFRHYGLEVFRVERGSRYGGNIRAYIAFVGARPVDPSVGALLQREVDAGLHRPETWDAFRTRVLTNRDRFMEFAYRTHRQGKSLAGYSCPGRATPLLNFFGITPDLVPYISELPKSLKLGKFVPGAHIPIVGSDRLSEDQPDHILVFAWHYLEAITRRLRDEGIQSPLLTILPDFAGVS